MSSTNSQGSEMTDAVGVGEGEPVQSVAQQSPNGTAFVDRSRITAPIRIAHDQIILAREIARKYTLIVLVVAQLQARATVERTVKVMRPVGQWIVARFVLERWRVRDGWLKVLLRKIKPALVRLGFAEAVIKLARPKAERGVERELHRSAYVQMAPQPVPEAIVHLQKLYVPVVRFEPVPPG
uniref:Uncharacterized protein n=1 Tax=Anopheles culicifacies TaxID=139723 RepID=A0A182MNP3_9DIPT